MRDVDRCQRIIGDDVEQGPGSGAQQCPFCQQGGQRALQAAQIEHFR
jgi:hypothetical protein